MIVVVIVLIFQMIWVGDGQGVKRIARLAFLTCIFIVVVYGVFAYLVPKYKFAGFLEFDSLTTRQGILEYDDDPGSQRILGYKILYKFIFKDWIDVMFGLGSGAATGSMEVHSKANATFLTHFPLGAPDGIYFMLTIGAIGLILVISILVYGIVWVKNYLQIETGPFMRMIGYSFPSLTVACLLSILYTQVWSSQIGLTYWVVAGVLANRHGAFVERT